MKLKQVNHLAFGVLEQRLRGVPLVKKDDDGNPIFVYEQAHIKLREFHPDELNPTTFYLVEENLERQRALREYLMKEHGLDPLHLDGLYEFETESGERFGLMPPVIEAARRSIEYVPSDEEIQYKDAFTVTIPIINDGAHRIFHARELGETVHAVMVTGANPDFPFYAHPNEWDRIQVFDKVPATKEEKKLYAREDCYALYRDFGVLNCGAPRGTSSEKK